MAHEQAREAVAGSSGAAPAADAAVTEALARAARAEEALQAQTKLREELAAAKEAALAEAAHARAAAAAAQADRAELESALREAHAAPRAAPQSPLLFSPAAGGGGTDGSVEQLLAALQQERAARVSWQNEARVAQEQVRRASPRFHLASSCLASACLLVHRCVLNY
jgi:hypothetical protein